MLNLFRSGALTLAAAFTLTGTAAQAESHEVLIVDGSYFPYVIFATEGDEIVFRNESGANHYIVGANDSWQSGAIPPNGTFQIELEEETPLTFSGTGGGFEQAYGEIVMAELPDADDAD